VPRELPSFDLVVATVGRAEELARLLDSLEAQTLGAFRTIVVDQNPDDRVDAVLAPSALDIQRIRSEPGLSRARNAALAQLTGDVVAFPDDDCTYPPDLLARVAERFADDASLDGLTGRAADAAGHSSASWQRDPARLTELNLWNRAISFTIFLRRHVVERVGRFDERLGLGSPEPWASGEEIDYLLRAIRADARIEYDPSLVVVHDAAVDEASIAYRDGASVGYLLRKHGYPARTTARMLIRPVGGALVSIGRGDRGRARYYVASVRGRLRGLRAGPSSAKSSA
jgi:glycosyltransferase involved in cell wall biosynthesis